MVSTLSRGTPDPTPHKRQLNDGSAGIWYFAYGSNLLRSQMKERTEEQQESRTAVLRGYRVAFNKQGSKGPYYANIVPDAGGEVHGVIYRCSDKAMKVLDRREGGYSRNIVYVETADGKATKAIAYIADRPVDERRPKDDYLDKIVTGAREHGLPADYIAHIETHAHGLRR